MKENNFLLKKRSFGRIIYIKLIGLGMLISLFIFFISKITAEQASKPILINNLPVFSKYKKCSKKEEGRKLKQVDEKKFLQV